jgi:hypothetical protein
MIPFGDLRTQHHVETGRRPLTDGVAGLAVVRIAEGGTKSMANHGRMVELRTARAELA